MNVFAYLFLVLVVVAIIAYILLKPILKARSREKAASQPFKTHWRRIIQRRMPYFRQMPDHLQLQLKRHILVFISEKRFVGCQGIEINDDIRITIAAQACLLLLNRQTDYYPKLKSILVYPRAFVKRHQNIGQDGIHSVKDSVLAGESWGHGNVVLSWHDTLEGAHLPDDGRNVVIHEFAHQLDQESGSANGAPILQQSQSYQQWSQIFAAEFAQLQQRATRGEPSVFDYYGATNPAEFFAVASEVFFEKSNELQQFHRSLYEQLSRFYQVDPSAW
ncbi:zinc-dependent peptidase [Ningiella sp. W23]|uniref:M90 family metallopeptidase n=1 Tax=Ningiella sp. W23 TaxID=3023715 RepID=UPI0037579F6B